MSANKPEISAMRSANGQFVKGCKPGPGRPKKSHRSKFHDGELLEIAQPINPRDLFLLANQLDGMEEVVEMIIRGKHSEQTKKTIMMDVENRNLATLLINQMLLEELAARGVVPTSGKEN